MTTPNLNQALVRAQAKFGPIKRTLTGKVQSEKAKYEYDYAPLDSVLDACRGPLTDNGLSWTMEFVEDVPAADPVEHLVTAALGRLDAKTQDGAAYAQGVTAIITRLGEHLKEREASSRFCRLRLKTTLRHISGEEISTSLPLLFGKAWPNMQDLGSASTYAARYTFCRLVGVHAESDDDAMHAANIQGQYGQREPRGDRRQQQQQQGRRQDQQRPQQPQGQVQQRPLAPQQPDPPQQQPAPEPPPHPAPPAEQPQPAAEPPAQPQLTNGLGEPVDWPVPDRKLEPGEWEKFSLPQQVAYARSRVAKHVGDMTWLNKYTDWVRTHSTWPDAEFNGLLHYAAELSMAQEAQTQTH
jgi:hypothetical protein